LPKGSVREKTPAKITARIVPASSKATHTTAIAISDQIKRKNPTIETCRWKIARHGEITSAKRGFSTASTPRISREQRRFAVASRVREWHELDALVGQHAT
jgi:hypothetical protein